MKVDDPKAVGAADEWEPGQQTVPPWLGLILLTMASATLAALLGIAVWAWRMVAG